MRIALIASLFNLAAGHGRMTHPPSRDGSTMATAGDCKLPNEPRDLTAADGRCRWFSQGCQPGCSECTDSFGANDCKTPKEPTVTDPKARTWKIPNHDGPDWTKYNPWRSPGHAPIFSPCGLAGGGKTYHPDNGALAPKGVPQGMDGRDLPEMVGWPWSQGSTQEVAWSIHANHGGGYAYRLCKKDREITEECFQSGHLQFASDDSWIQYGANKKNRTAFTSYRITEGTHPKGSMWSRAPIPACGDPSGGEGCAETWGEPVPGCGPNPGDKNASRGFVCTLPPMFEPPMPNLYGYGWSACFDGCGDGKSVCTAEKQQYEEELFKFNIIDKVLIPPDLPVGEYLLSFRWDCEQTPQIWSQCADVTITEAAPPMPGPPGPKPTQDLPTWALVLIVVLAVSVFLLAGIVVFLLGYRKGAQAQGFRSTSLLSRGNISMQNDSTSNVVPAHGNQSGP